MLTVEDIEKSVEIPKKQKQQFGTLFEINPYERLEKKEILKNLGRNSKCICGSGKKFKKCCISKMRFENTYELEDNRRPQKVKTKNEMTEIFGPKEIAVGSITGPPGHGSTEKEITNKKVKNKAKQNRKNQKQRHKTIGR